jgi:mono/diheme cytochrome c family protein
MFKKILKWVGVVFAVLVGLLIIAGIASLLVSRVRGNKTYEITAANLTIPTDDASIREGARLTAIRACSECHGDHFEGKLLFEDPAMGSFYPTNISGGEGSEVGSYTASDWDRAIRHGVDPAGKPLIAMPSAEYSRISDEDLALMIAYLQSLDAVDNSLPETSLGPLGTVLVAVGLFPYAAADIDHDTPPPATVAREVSAAYGEYLAATCTGCHTPEFSGGSQIGAPADSLPPANLTPAGNLGNWTQEDFINTLRTGTTPEGKVLDPEEMPWPITALMTDDELAAIWLFLNTVEPVETDW